MNANLLNPFLQAAVEVLNVEVDANVARGEIRLEKSSMTSDDITVLINLVGDIYGVVMYGMRLSTGLSMVSRIMGQEFTEMNPLAQSGIAELGNVISGRATIRFSEAGYQSNISTPTVLIGSGVQVSTLDFPRIVVPLNTRSGLFTVHLALREKPSGTLPNPVEHISLAGVPASQKNP
ncbi:MAG: chemotaxis protein CheX [Chloroflexi bacterium]|nr:chemotaxis protein CheX [Chloroflexota bacterium]